MARMPFRSMTSRACSGVVRATISSPIATPFSESFTKVRWVWMSITGKRGVSTRVSGTWSMLFGRKSSRRRSSPAVGQDFLGSGAASCVFAHPTRPVAPRAPIPALFNHSRRCSSMSVSSIPRGGPREDPVNPAGQRQGVVEAAQPHVAAEHHAGGPGALVQPHLGQDAVVPIVLLAAGEQHQHPSRRADDPPHPGRGVLLQGAVGLGHVAGVRGGLVQLHDVRPQLLGHPGRVVLGVERAPAAPGVDPPAPRIGPHHQGHAQALAVLAHLAVLAQLEVLPGGAHVDRVAHRVGPEAHRVLHRGVGRGDRLARRRGCSSCRSA